MCHVQVIARTAHPVIKRLDDVIMDVIHTGLGISVSVCINAKTICVSLKNMDIKIVINDRMYSRKNESQIICERNIHVTF